MKEFHEAMKKHWNYHLRKLKYKYKDTQNESML